MAILTVGAVDGFFWRPTKRSEVEDLLKFVSTDIPFAPTPVFVVDISTAFRCTRINTETWNCLLCMTFRRRCVCAVFVGWQQLVL